GTAQSAEHLMVLSLFDRISHRCRQNRGAVRSCGLHSRINLIRSHERADAVVNGNNLCLTKRHQAAEHGLRARRTASHSSRYSFQSKVLRERKKVSRLFGGKDGYDFVDLLGALKLPERVNDNRNSA